MSPTDAGRLLLVRHGATEWSRAGRHTGRTDLPLLPEGEAGARALAPLLAGYDLRHAVSSPLLRARRTAELAGLTPAIDPDLVEWDYGGYEGWTTAQIRERLGRPWRAFEDGVIAGDTPGETVEEVAARASRVLERLRPLLADGDVAVVAHGHLLRILTATWLRQAARFGAHLVLEPAHLSVLGHEREVPAILAWNLRP